MKNIIYLALVLISALPLKSQNKFAFELFNTFKEDENTFISPISIKTAFAMVYEGAKGTTKHEFDSVFNFRPDNAEFIKELEDLKEISDINNSLWVKKGLKVEKKYKNKLSDLYQSEPFEVDFFKKPKKAADSINSWIERKTKGLITKMVEASVVKGLSMAIINTVYFKQDWAVPFDKKETKEQKFKNFNKSKTKTEFMYARSYFNASVSKQESIITLPYKKNKTSMVIIMPDKMKGYELNLTKYNNLILNQAHQEVIVKMPKFSYGSPTIELKNKIKEIGLERALSNNADFSLMTKDEALKIGTVLHKAKIIVNEEGTEAAAATVIGMAMSTDAVYIPVEPLEITIDKPFYYFIKDNKTNTILFMGKMNNLPKD